MVDDHKFEKELAIIQLKANVAALIGSILLSIGSALIIFSYTIDPVMVNPESLVHTHYIFGMLMIAIGIGVLVGSLSKKPKQIRNL